jgi:hypothetical protein
MNILIVLLIGFIIIVLFDAIGSILSRTLNFNYAWLLFGSIVIYGLIGIYAFKYGNTIIGVISSLLAGIFDSTIGLKISKKLKAKISNDINFNITLKTVVPVSLFAAIIGYISILIFT